MSESANEALELTQKEAAAKLNIETRQLRRIPNSYTGRLESGLYPWPGVHEGYIRWKQDEKLRRTGHEPAGKPYEEARARKVAAQARLVELEVAQREKLLVSIDDVEAMLREPLDGVRSKLLNAPSKYAPRLVGASTIPEAMRLLQGIIDELMAELAATADEVGEDADGSPAAA